MEKQIKLKFKIGNIIEFEAEGTTEDVEKQRTAFMETVFPSAVEAVKLQTIQHNSSSELINNNTTVELLPSNETEITSIGIVKEDLSRTSLSSFIKRYGELSEQDFVLFAAYFDEQRNNIKEFNSDSVKQYYTDARRTPYSNNSMLINRLIQKGFIMDAITQNVGKFYMLTAEGISYVENYTPKEGSGEKKPKKVHKQSAKFDSQYAMLTADDLNLNNYPKVKDQKGAINQLILALYIVTNEEKGEWFNYIDIEHVFKNIFEIPFNVSTVKHAINNHKSWFNCMGDDKNNKANKYKLLSGAKDEALRIIQENMQSE